nr:MAG TPA: hypothetical protein [Bacteriophage sp.]
MIVNRLFEIFLNQIVYLLLYRMLSQSIVIVNRLFIIF